MAAKNAKGAKKLLVEFRLYGRMAYTLPRVWEAPKTKSTRGAISAIALQRTQSSNEGINDETNSALRAFRASAVHNPKFAHTG